MMANDINNVIDIDIVENIRYRYVTYNIIQYIQYYKIKVGSQVSLIKRFIQWTQNVVSGMNLILATFHRFIDINSESISKTKYYDTDKNQINYIENRFSFYKSIQNY